MRSVASAKIKIQPTKAVVMTIKAYTKALQFCVDYAWKKGIKNNIKLHHKIYYTIRKRFKLPSQLTVSCLKQSCGIIKKAKTKPIIKNTSVRYNFPRTANIKENKLILRLLNKREEFKFTIPACYKEYFNWDVKESLLRMDRKGRCFFVFTFSKEVYTIKLNNTSQKFVLGVDLGVNNLAVCSNGRFYNSSVVKQAKRKFKYLRAKLQAKGTKASKRLLKKLSGKETRYMAWINHNISKNIIANFNGGKIVMENLKGIRNKNRGKKMNYWISNWSFFQLQSFIQYKAERRGILVERVKPNYTSQICHKCGRLGSRSKHIFSCKHCFSSYNADLNASKNLSHPMLGKRQALVNVPHSTCDDVKASLNDDLRLNTVESLVF